MLPAGPPVSTREMMVRLAAAAGRRAEVQRLPRLLISLLAAFVPLFREILEMDYQWSGRFEVDGRRFQERFGFAPTPLEEAIRQTAEWGVAAHPAKG
jgi:nucleoside-diphosphate-sugar epimerase